MQNFIFILILSVLFLGCSTVEKKPNYSQSAGIGELARGNQTLAEKIFEDQCQKGERAGCIERGDLYGAFGKAKLASEYYSKACTLGSSFGCFKYGVEKFLEGDLKTAATLFEKTCNEIYASCQYLGIIYESQGNNTAAIKQYGDQCEKNHLNGCVLRGYIDETAGKYKSAKSWYKKACDLKSQLGCGFLSIMEIMVGKKQIGIELASKDCLNGGSKTCRISKLYAQISQNSKLPNQWMKECNQKNANSCYSSGLFQSLNLKTFHESKKTLQKACNLGNGFGCLELGSFLSRYRDHKKYAATKIEGCRKGAGPACSVFGERSFPYKVEKPAFDYLEEGCKKGDGRACSKIAIQYWNSKSKAMEYYRKSCDNKYLDGCFWLARLEQQKTLPDTLRALCSKGHTQSCEKMGDALVKLKNIDSAMNYYQKACEGNQRLACYRVVELKSQKTPEFDKTIEFKKLCKGGHNFSCYKLGELFYASGSKEEAESHLKLGCDRLDGNSCGYLGYISSKDGDKEKASQWLRKACDYGDAYGCRNM